MAKFGGHVLRHFASSLSNVIRQVGRKAGKNFGLGNFFKLKCLAFGSYLIF